MANHSTAVSSTAELKQRIAELEKQQRVQRLAVVSHVEGMVESVKPKNLIMAGLQSISETPALRQNFINALVSLSTGWIARKLAVPKSDTIVRKAVGSAVQYGVSHLMATQGDNISDVVGKFLGNFKRHRH